ncbi:MAG: PHP-associated domain-containing protein [Dehalococcoidia bacterium]
MIFDLHTHSTLSDDSRASVEQYIKWISVLRRKGYNIDGFVLTEHRQFNFDIDYTQISKDNNVTILKGAELDTDSGHFLVYGITEEIAKHIKFNDVNMSATNLIDVCLSNGAIAVPAHPGRFGIGFIEYVDKGNFESINIVEHLNGSYRPGEQDRTEKLISDKGYLGIGGSDAHMVSAIGACLTEFDDAINSEKELVKALTSKKFKSIKLEDTK